MLTADRLAMLLGLRPLPEEGGLYAETYRAETVSPDALPAPYTTLAGPHPLATAIYYLLTADTFSALHRLPSDEIFHFYLGDPVEMLQLHPDGSGRVVTIGPDFEAGMRPQIVVPRGVWQGSCLTSGGPHGYALLGTTMAPGFAFTDYEGGRRDELTAAYPVFQELIAALTR